jgi:hypothetical protein
MIPVMLVVAIVTAILPVTIIAAAVGVLPLNYHR